MRFQIRFIQLGNRSPHDRFVEDREEYVPEIFQLHRVGNMVVEVVEREWHGGCF